MCLIYCSRVHACDVLVCLCVLFVMSCVLSCVSVLVALCVVLCVSNNDAMCAGVWSVWCELFMLVCDCLVWLCVCL